LVEKLHYIPKKEIEGNMIGAEESSPQIDGHHSKIILMPPQI
jgi:hypothetical protein